MHKLYHLAFQNLVSVCICTFSTVVQIIECLIPTGTVTLPSCTGVLNSNQPLTATQGGDELPSYVPGRGYKLPTCVPAGGNKLPKRASASWYKVQLTTSTPNLAHLAWMHHAISVMTGCSVIHLNTPQTCHTEVSLILRRMWIEHEMANLVRQMEAVHIKD